MAGLVVENGTGLSNANSYMVTATVDSYAQGRAYSAEWTLSDADTKDQLARNATSILDDLIAWYGTKVQATQALGFPRTGVATRENNGTLPSNVVPTPIVEAACELAIQLAKSKLLDQSTKKITSMSVAGMSTSLEDKESSGSKQDPIPSAVYDKIRHFGRLRVDEPSFSLSRKLWG